MPYVEIDSREVYNPQIDALVEQLTHFGENKTPSAGHVNYVIFKLLNDIYNKNGCSYIGGNSLVGVLECVKQEFYNQNLTKFEI